MSGNSNKAHQASAPIHKLFSNNLPVSDGFRTALAALLAAYDYAVDSQFDLWQLAIELDELMSYGTTLSDLRWLLLRNFAEHAMETTIPGDPTRTFRLLAFTHWPAGTCFLLTPSGAFAIRELLASQPLRKISLDVDNARELPHAHQPIGMSRVMPEWDAARRELRYAGQVVKRFRVPAQNQALILAAFQEERWPTYIDDPLPPASDKNPKQRLQATLKSLNRNQRIPLLRFHGNGNGLQIFWEVIESQ